MHSRTPKSNVFASAALRSSAQDAGSLFDTPFPSTYAADDAVSVPAVNTSQFHFSTITGTADQQQALFTYSQGFPAVACGNTSESFNISFSQLHTPDGSQDYAVHLSLQRPYPNNLTGAIFVASAFACHSNSMWCTLHLKVSQAILPLMLSHVLIIETDPHEVDCNHDCMQAVCNQYCLCL